MYLTANLFITVDTFNNVLLFLAITSLRGALWSLFRNILAVGFLYGFCYGAMLVSANTKVICLREQYLK